MINSGHARVRGQTPSLSNLKSPEMLWDATQPGFSLPETDESKTACGVGKVNCSGRPVCRFKHFPEMLFGR